VRDQSIRDEQPADSAANDRNVRSRFHHHHTPVRMLVLGIRWFRTGAGAENASEAFSIQASSAQDFPVRSERKVR
jgi:hypothetical protein